MRSYILFAIFQNVFLSKLPDIEPTRANNKSPPPADPRIEWIDPMKITRGFGSIKKSRKRSSSVSRDNLLRQHMVNSATSFSAHLGKGLFYLFGSAASFGVARLPGDLAPRSENGGNKWQVVLPFGITCCNREFQSCRLKHFGMG
jgi:hypothetical protein